MSRAWKQPRNIVNGKASLEQPQTIFVRVASFTFRFDTVQQLRDCLRYYEQKIHSSSRVPARELKRQLGDDWRRLRSWEVERWFERLPMYLLETPKREKVVKALNRALMLLESGKLSSSESETEEYAIHMPRMIKLRNVPDDLHRRLKARAALAGMSLSDYLISEIREIAERPTLAEMRSRMRKHKPVALTLSAARLIRDEREGRY